MNLMLFERKFEIRTRGLVCGLAVEEAPPSPIPTVNRIGILDRSRNFMFLRDAAPITRAWRPHFLHYKVVISSRESGEIIWQRPFATKQEALFCYASLIGVDAPIGVPVQLPPVFYDGEVEIRFATVVSVNSTTTNSALDWIAGGTLCPSGVSSVDALVIAGGGGAGRNFYGSHRGGGGGGAGGYRYFTAQSVTPGSTYTLTVGAKGTGGNTDTLDGVSGTRGGDSVFGSNTSAGGGAGRGHASFNPYMGTDRMSGGSGGGETSNITAGGTGNTPSTSPAQGYSAGNGSDTPSYAGSGGGGSSSASGNASGGTPSAGGAATSNSITGSSVARAGGGGAAGGGGNSAGGGGGAGDATTVDATANTGSGGAGRSLATCGDGGTGIIILSFTQLLANGGGPIFLPFMP